jgi:flagellar basal body rod protein FlgG
MVSILGAAAGGLAYGQALIDIVGHNLANVNTFSFKRTRIVAEGSPKLPGEGGEGAHMGVSVLTEDRIFSTGFAQTTGDPLNFSIGDDSFFRVRNLDGSPALTRYGALSVDGAGQVIVGGLRQLDPPVTLPEGFSHPAINNDGTIVAMNLAGEKREIGRITLVRFKSPQTLEALGEGMYRPTVNSGTAVDGFPGDPGFDPVVVGALEGSNVEIATEFANLIIGQRAYQASAKTFSVGDAMFAIATNLTK